MTAPRVMLVLDLGRLDQAAAASGRPDVLVQLRDRNAPARALVEAARALVVRGVRLVVNDRVDVARAAGALGVHLPEEGLPVETARSLLAPGSLVGVSLHVGSRMEERAAGADWAVFGPVFETPGKGSPTGVDALAAAVRRCPCPVLAIGGIDPDRVREVRRTGAAGVAVVRAAVALEALVAAVEASP